MAVTPAENPEEAEKEKTIQVLDKQDIKLLTTFVRASPLHSHSLSTPSQSYSV